MSTRDDDHRDYEVGYGRPPEHSRFKKGQSGNPRGRPPGAKGLKASLKREMQAKITVSEGKSRMTISKAEALAKRVVAMALSGDAKAITKLLEIDDHVFSEDPATVGEAARGLADAVDYEMLAHFFGGRAGDEGSVGTLEPAEEEPE
jgi:hypothetical protein